jgi:DNA-binding NarL/FixJ family response regulator
VNDSAAIRVLIVDDHSVVRMGLAMFFDLQDDIEVVGEAPTARRAWRWPAASSRRRAHGPADAEHGRRHGDRPDQGRAPETEIVTMTSFIEEEQVTAALEAGASGYVLKDAEAEEVAAAVRAAYAGEVHLDPAVARLLAQRMRNRKSPEALAEPLTEREKDVLRLLGRG